MMGDRRFGLASRGNPRRLSQREEEGNEAGDGRLRSPDADWALGRREGAAGTPFLGSTCPPTFPCFLSSPPSQTCPVPVVCWPLRWELRSLGPRRGRGGEQGRVASTPGEASVSERDRTRDGSVGPSGQGLCGGDGPVGRRARGASAAAQIGVRRPRLARWWVGSGSPARRSVGHGARRVPSARCCRSPGPSPRRPGPGPGARCLQDNSARQCQGRPLLGSARGRMCCCCCGRCPPRAHPERASLGDRASVGRWRRLGPECRVPRGSRCQRGRATRGRACLSLPHLPRWVLLDARGRGPGLGEGQAACGQHCLV